MSAEDPGLAGSIERDVMRAQQQMGREPTGILRPETELALRERQIQQAQQEIARETGIQSTITRRPEEGPITVESARPPRPQRQGFRTEGDTEPLFISPTGVFGTPTTAILSNPEADVPSSGELVREIERRTAETPSPIAQLAGVEGEEVAQAEQEFAEEGGVVPTLFRAGEVTQEAGQVGARGIQRGLPIEDVGPEVGREGVTVGGQVESLAGQAVVGFPTLVGGAALQVPAAFGGLGEQLREQPSPEEQIQERQRIESELLETAGEAGRQTTVEFALDRPVEAGLVAGLAAGPAAGRAGVRGAGRVGRGVRARAPERAVEVAETAAERGRAAETRFLEGVQRADTAVRGGERTVMARELEVPERPTREFEVQEPRLEVTEEGVTRVPGEESLIPVEQLREIDRGADIEITAAEGEAPLLEVSETGRGPQTQTTIEAFEGGRPVLEELRVGQEPRSLVETRMQIQRAMEQQEARRVSTERQFQERLGEQEGFEVLAERTGTRQVPRPDLPTREGFEVTERPSVVGERPAPVQEGQTGLPQEVARIREPSFLERIRGQEREIEILEPEFVEETTRGLGITREEPGTRGQLELLGREGEPRTEIEPAEGFEFVEAETPSFEVQGAEFPGLERAAVDRPPIFPGFEFGQEPREDIEPLFPAQEVTPPDIEQFEEDLAATEFEEDLQTAQEERMIAPIDLEAMEVMPDLESEVIAREELETDVGLDADVRELTRPFATQRPRQTQESLQMERQIERQRIDTPVDTVPEPDVPPPFTPPPDTPGPRVPPPGGLFGGAAGRGRRGPFGFLFGAEFRNPIELDILGGDGGGEEEIDLV